MVISSFLIGTVTNLLANEHDGFRGLQSISQVNGKVICLPGYYYHTLSPIVLAAEGTVLFKETLDGCLQCMTGPTSYDHCGISRPDGVLYDYGILRDALEDMKDSRPDDYDMLAIAELGVFPHADHGAHVINLSWGIPDQRYCSTELRNALKEVHRAFKEFLGTDEFHEWTAPYSGVENVDPRLLGNVDPNFREQVYPTTLMIESGFLVAFTIIVFSLGALDGGKSVARARRRLRHMEVGQMCQPKSFEQNPDAQDSFQLGELDTIEMAKRKTPGGGDRDELEIVHPFDV